MSFSRNQSDNSATPARSQIENSFDLNPDLPSRPTAEITIDGDAAFVASNEIFVRNANIGVFSYSYKESYPLGLIRNLYETKISKRSR